MIAIILFAAFFVFVHGTSADSLPSVSLPDVPDLPQVELPESPVLPDVPDLPFVELPFVPDLGEMMSEIWEEFANLMAFINELASALFSWDSSSWDEMRKTASDYWNSKADSSLVGYFYKSMAGLADYGSRLNLGLLAFSIIPFASITKLFAGSVEAGVTLGAVEASIPGVTVELLTSGPSAVAGVGNGIKYVAAGNVGIQQALINNPISTVLIKHEAAHIIGASEVTAWKITSQAFSSLSWGEKIQSLGTLAGANVAISSGLESVLPTLNRTFMQLGYFGNAFKGFTWNIWKGY